jgi:uncharacterized membrane protein
MVSVQIGDLTLADRVADLIEVAAVIVIAVGVVAAILGGIITRIQEDGRSAFAKFRRLMARGLLIGLDLLIAADIIKTVTLEPTLENIAALGLLILIRTFLTWTLLVETDGRWPWQQDKAPTSDS